MEATRKPNDLPKVVEMKSVSRFLCPVRIFLRNEGRIMIFSDDQKLKECVAGRLTL